MEPRSTTSPHQETSSSIEFTLIGRVVSGLGEGALFTSLDWARNAFQTRLGFDPWPGTLNLEVSPAAWAKALRRAGPGISIDPPEGYCAARCYSGVVGRRIHGAIVLPEVEGYPDDKIEFLAPVSVRETLGLADGDRVEILVRV